MAASCPHWYSSDHVNSAGVLICTECGFPGYPIPTIADPRDAKIASLVKALEDAVHIIDNARSDYGALSEADVEWMVARKAFYSEVDAIRTALASVREPQT